MLSLISWTDLCVWVLWKRHRWKMRIFPRTSVWTLLRSSSLTYLQFFLFFTWSMKSSSWTLWWGKGFVLLFNFLSSWQGNVTYRLQISRRSLDDLILGHECQIGTLQISFWILPSQQKRAFSMSHRTEGIRCVRAMGQAGVAGFCLQMSGRGTRVCYTMRVTCLAFILTPWLWWKVYDDTCCFYNDALDSYSVWKWKVLRRVRLFGTPWTIQSMELSRSECWSG